MRQILCFVVGIIFFYYSVWHLSPFHIRSRYLSLLILVGEICVIFGDGLWGICSLTVLIPLSCGNARLYGLLFWSNRNIAVAVPLTIGTGSVWRFAVIDKCYTTQFTYAMPNVYIFNIVYKMRTSYIIIQREYFWPRT